MSISRTAIRDDVWLSEKMETLYQAVLSQKAVMSYCDMAVIDAKSDVIATSLKANQTTVRVFNRFCADEVVFL